MSMRSGIPRAEIEDDGGRMNRDDAEEYTQALGQVTAGGFRQVYLGVKLGVPDALGLSTDQWVDRLGGYVKLSVPDRREAVRELAEDGLSQRQIADVLGVNHNTVSRDLRVSNDTDSDSDEAQIEDEFVSNDTPLFAVVDLETGQIVEPDRPPLPDGPTPHQRAATNPARKWTEAMHDIWVRLNAVRDGGGIVRVTADWGELDRAAFVEEAERIIDVMTEWRAALKG